jgi:hypothetical protein
MNRKTKDLFGRELKTRRPAYEAALEKRDSWTRPQRAARVRWLKQKLPGGMGMPMDTMFVFNEATSSFIDGYFVATIVLSSAFAEHWIAGHLEARGLSKEASRGLDSCIQSARRLRMWPDLILDRLDYLRKVRNPFVHLKKYTHEHSLNQRSYHRGLDAGEVAEADAKHALETVSALVHARPA